MNGCRVFEVSEYTSETVWREHDLVQCTCCLKRSGRLLQYDLLILMETEVEHDTHGDVVMVLYIDNQASHVTAQYLSNNVSDCFPRRELLRKHERNRYGRIEVSARCARADHDR